MNLAALVLLEPCLQICLLPCGQGYAVCLAVVFRDKDSTGWLFDLQLDRFESCDDESCLVIVMRMSELKLTLIASVFWKPR